MGKQFFYKNIVINTNIVEILQVQKQHLLIRGPLGVVVLILPKEVLFKKKKSAQVCLFSLVVKQNLVKTYVMHLKNKIKGVCLGFSEVLVINGVGWFVSKNENSDLVFSVGFSHKIVFSLKKSLEVMIYNKQCFKIFGLDLELVQMTVAQICRLRDFDVFKGKGIFKKDDFKKLKSSSKSRS